MKTSEISLWEWVSEPRTQSTRCNRLSWCGPGDWNVISNINSGVCWEFQNLELKALDVTACHDVGLVIGMWLAPINSGVCWEFQNLELKALAVTACHDVGLNVISTYQLWSLLRVWCTAENKDSEHHFTGYLWNQRTHMSSATFHHSAPHTRTSRPQGFANFLDVVKLGSQTDWYRLSQCTSTCMMVPMEPWLHTYPGQLVNLNWVRTGPEWTQHPSAHQQGWMVCVDYGQEAFFWSCLPRQGYCV
jgi:hypothetical protein